MYLFIYLILPNKAVIATEGNSFSFLEFFPFGPPKSVQVINALYVKIFSIIFLARVEGFIDFFLNFFGQFC